MSTKRSSSEVQSAPQNGSAPQDGSAPPKKRRGKRRKELVMTAGEKEAQTRVQKLSAGRVCPSMRSFKRPEWVDARTRKSGPGRSWKNLKQILHKEKLGQLPVGTPTYLSIAAGASRLPPTKYCDLTGLPAKYTDPRTGLRYARADLYAHVRATPPDQVQALLKLRSAGLKLK